MGRRRYNIFMKIIAHVGMEIYLRPGDSGSACNRFSASAADLTKTSYQRMILDPSWRFKWRNGC